MKKYFTNIYFCLIEGEPGKADVGEALLDAVTAGDHLNMDIQMEGKCTLLMCLCNQYNNFVLCVKHLFSIWTMDHVLFGVRLKFTVALAQASY